MIIPPNSQSGPPALIPREHTLLTLVTAWLSNRNAGFNRSESSRECDHPWGKACCCSARGCYPWGNTTCHCSCLSVAHESLCLHRHNIPQLSPLISWPQGHNGSHKSASVGCHSKWITWHSTRRGCPHASSAEGPTASGTHPPLTMDPPVLKYVPCASTGPHKGQPLLFYVQKGVSHMLWGRKPLHHPSAVIHAD